MSHGRLEAVIAACQAVLDTRPSGLFADVDGTLSRITPVPDAAVVPTGIKAALMTLTERVDLVVAVTGRGVVDARRMIGLDSMGYFGNHGLERWQDGQVLVHPRAQPSVPMIQAAFRQLSQTVHVSGLIFEDKGVSASIHYRLAPDPVAARQRLLQAIGALASASALRVTEGRMVLNLLPRLALDKGSAVVELVRQHQLRGAVFIGDDMTDLDAVRALQHLRATSDVRTFGVAVLSPDGPPELAQLADGAVEGVDDVELLLGALATRAAKHLPR